MRTRLKVKELFPEQTICEAFLAREDIAQLPKAEQQRRWEEHQNSLDGVFKFLARTELKVVK
jgi:hypothetical protein